MQTDTRPPSELKFVLEIDFLKKPEAIGPGLPSPFFFKADGRALVRVNKTPGINLGKETDPYDWYRSVINSIPKKIDRSSIESQGN